MEDTKEENSYDQDQSFYSADEDEEKDRVPEAPIMTVRRSLRTPKPRNFEGYISYLAIDRNNDNDPQTVQEAMSNEDLESWKKAMSNEMDSLAKNETWELVELPPNTKAIKSKFSRPNTI